MQGPVDVEDERHPPHHPVGIRPPIEKADTGGVLRQLRQGRQSPGRRGQEVGRVVAGGDETRLGGAGPARRIRDEAAEDDGRALYRMRERVVRRLSSRRGVVGAVFLREQEIEGDRRNPGVLSLSTSTAIFSRGHGH